MRRVTRVADMKMASEEHIRPRFGQHVDGVAGFRARLERMMRHDNLDDGMVGASQRIAQPCDVRLADPSALDRQ